MLSGPAGGSAFFCAPILLPGGEPPAIGALLAGFEQPAGTCLECVHAQQGEEIKHVQPESTHALHTAWPASMLQWLAAH